MTISISGIHVIDVLYRVSTRAQENEGESLFNQRREVEEKWAVPNGISVRRRIEVTESGKSALRLSGAGFAFSRRAEYTQLILDYQNSRQARPDAIAIDWIDRWNRNVLEYSALITAFRMLNIRLISVGDGLDLTDPRNDLVTHVRAAIGQEQLRIIGLKISESRRSRRERGKWQGGSPPDGYRTHEPSCAGLIETAREGPDGKKHTIRVRACKCDPTALYRDPTREPALGYIWQLLQTSPLSWAAMTDEVNARGFRRLNGTPFRWHDLYRIGENPHYAGGLTTDRWHRDREGNVIGRKPLQEQTILWDAESIHDPYVTRATFESNHTRRFDKITRNIPRSPRGGVSELTGILVCPACQRQMSSITTLSPLLNRNGKPRKTPRKRYPNMQCSHAKQYHPTCSNKNQVRVATISLLLINHIEQVAQMPDDAILTALRLYRSEGNVQMLERERDALRESMARTDDRRRYIHDMVTRGAQTPAEGERDIFALQRTNTEAQARIREIDVELSRQHAKPDFQYARSTITWLAANWSQLAVREKAEALRLLLKRATYTANGTAHPAQAIVLEYGPAFIEPVTLQGTKQVRRRA